MFGNFIVGKMFQKEIRIKREFAQHMQVLCVIIFLINSFLFSEQQILLSIKIVCRHSVYLKKL